MAEEDDQSREAAAAVRRLVGRSGLDGVEIRFLALRAAKEIRESAVGSNRDPKRKAGRKRLHVSLDPTRASPTTRQALRLAKAYRRLAERDVWAPESLRRRLRARAESLEGMERMAPFFSTNQPALIQLASFVAEGAREGDATRDVLAYADLETSDAKDIICVVSHYLEKPGKEDSVGRELAANLEPSKLKRAYGRHTDKLLARLRRLVKTR